MCADLNIIFKNVKSQTTNLINEIRNKERTAYYEQEATQYIINLHKMVNYSYWCSFALLIILFFYKKIITFKKTKENLINCLILLAFAIYPHIIGYIYDVVINIVETLWGLLPTSVFSSGF